MNYPDFTALGVNLSELQEYARLKVEQGDSAIVKKIIKEVENYLHTTVNELKNLPDDPELAAKEPDQLEEIRKLRKEGPRKIWENLPDDEEFTDKMEGALYGRIIGCLLGVPVEGWTIERMEAFCDLIGKEFPPKDYWEHIEEGYSKNVYQRYRYEYLKSAMKEAPVDDDIIYTQVALLLMEQYGPDFTTEDVGRIWQKYIPYACTAEEVALKNLSKGVPIDDVAMVDNPYRQWIGAAIRSDGFAYAAAGYPEKAASMAYYDGYLSHRRNGIYGEMFLASAQSAAFAVKDPVEALRIGLTEIPAECNLYRDIEWALEAGKDLKDFREARRLVDERFKGMHVVHTNNNLCLVVFGLMLGQGDFLKTVSETVAMGMDNDCTAASAGSIIGAIVGKKNIPEYLTKRLNNTCDSYLRGVGKFKIDDMAKRFMAISKQIYMKR